MTTGALQMAAAFAATAGLILMLAPTALAGAARLPERGRRRTGLVIVLIAWMAMAGTLVPDSVSDRLSTPVGLAAGAAGVIIGLGLILLAGRLIARRPWTWFLLLGLALPVRIPI